MHDKHQIIEEPCEVKVSRTVLKTSGIGDSLAEFNRTKSKSGEMASKKQRKANRNKAKWSFAELHSYIDYKAVINGSLATKVPAHYTSQSCPKCGHTSKANRPNKGLIFRCECCGHELHADLIGSRNIALRTLFVRQDWMSTGVLSSPPNMSGVEAKAEVLLRFSELRWSLDISPHKIASLEGAAIGGG